MIRLPIGDSAVFNLTVQDKSQTLPGGGYPPLDISGGTVLLRVYQAGSVILSVNGSVTDGPNGKATIILDRTNSALLAIGQYSPRFIVQLSTQAQYTVHIDTLQVY